MNNSCKKCGKKIANNSQKCDACNREFWNRAQKIIGTAGGLVIVAAPILLKAIFKKK